MKITQEFLEHLYSRYAALCEVHDSFVEELEKLADTEDNDTNDSVLAEIRNLAGFVDKALDDYWMYIYSSYDTPSKSS